MAESERFEDVYPTAYTREAYINENQVGEPVNEEASPVDSEKSEEDSHEDDLFS